ncbi:MAG: NAD(P)H-hydrate dehydratase [Gemmobacter sp.]|nr:NAD(P)H-hydrate dehydratase [Gemmobacter sp.]
MRAVEATEIAAGNVTGLALMESAGAAVVAAVLEEWPDIGKTPRALVLCGPGNNGGDGYVVARLLAARGWAVTVAALGDSDRLPSDAAVMRGRWTGPVAVLDDGVLAGPAPDLMVDAVFGIGVTRPIPAAVARVLNATLSEFAQVMPDQSLRKVAVDCPSGLDLDTGLPVLDLPRGDPQDGARAVRADLTVTFHRAKCGHYLAQGPALCGKLRVVPIGLRDRERSFMHAIADRVWLVEPRMHGADLCPRIWAADLRKDGGHKYDHGHVLVMAGGVGRGGAARMAARAALRVGAGLVTVAPPPAALIENAARLDAIMLRACKDADALTQMLSDERINALVLGPGLGGGARTRDLVAAALGARRATVLDADALTSFTDDPAQLFAALHDRVVLTPHEGEFAGLFPDLGFRLRKQSKIDAVRQAAARSGAVVLLKGEDTVIAAPDGTCALHSASFDRAAPWLATAGAGDVLAGIIAGMLARHADAQSLVSLVALAAWLHLEAARSFGPGLIAEDLPEEIPGLLSRLAM